jgi:hypothetical protein
MAKADNGAIQILAKRANIRDRHSADNIGVKIKTADFRHFLDLARRLLFSRYDRRMVRRSILRRPTMTLSINLQKLALSVFGALVASSLFLSAAIGPVQVI